MISEELKVLHNVLDTTCKESYVAADFYCLISKGLFPLKTIQYVDILKMFCIVY